MGTIKTTSLFGVFSNAQRLSIIKTIATGPISVSEIAEKHDVDLGTVSRVLMHLRVFDLVSSEKIGRTNLYQLTQPEKVQELIAIAESLTT
jgi:DNA-binding transcriptional ArsR family regulator